MRLESVQVEKYKCIEDSNEFSLDQVTCLMGKNEAGKTSLLEALYKLNPVEEDKANFDELDYPRRHVTTYRERQGQDPDNVLTTEWILEDEDIQFMEEHLEYNVFTDNKITLKKGYDNIRYWTIKINEKKYVEHLHSKYKLSAPEKSQIQSANDLTSLLDKLKSLESPTDKHKKMLDYLNSITREDSLKKHIYDKLSSRLPKFIYFDAYHKLPGKVALTDLKSRRDSNNLTFGHKIFMALLDMTSSGLDEIESIGESEKLIMELEAIQNSLTDKIFKYWTQNRHLEVQFRFDHARQEDPAPFNEGYIFNTRIYNRRHRVTVNFDERSSGFIWFFSFLIWFSQLQKNYGNNLFILLDEPGLPLHGKAQKDLLNYINKELRPAYQVIYTAHSPFLIDLENIFSLRTVEDAVVKAENGSEKILGTKVGQRVFSRDEDTLFPLQGIVGFDIAQTMFVGPNVLVVEGPTEAALLNWFSRKLQSEGREALDIRWAVCPAEGANKISSFVTLFKGRGLKIAVLMDYHTGQKNNVKRLEESGLLEEGHLLKTSSYTEKEESDIEDLIGTNMYLFLVNQTMNLSKDIELNSDMLENENQRIVKFVEDYCRTLPIGYPEFYHYRPIEYLHNIQSEELNEIEGLDEAMNNFESLFSDLNSLI